MLKRYAAAFAVIAQFFCPMMARAASTDAARVVGDLKVDGIHLTKDGSVITQLSDAIGPKGDPGGYDFLSTAYAG